MSSDERVAMAPPFDNPHTQAGWDAALLELEHQAEHLEARGAFRAAVTLFDAIRIARTGGIKCDVHRTG
jgi:hypothetical protein